MDSTVTECLECGKKKKCFLCDCGSWICAVCIEIHVIDSHSDDED